MIRRGGIPQHYFVHIHRCDSAKAGVRAYDLSKGGIEEIAHVSWVLLPCTAVPMSSMAVLPIILPICSGPLISQRRCCGYVLLHSAVSTNTSLLALGEDTRCRFVAAQCLSSG